jgi:hypothetical protein
MSRSSWWLCGIHFLLHTTKVCHALQIAFLRSPNSLCLFCQNYSMKDLTDASFLSLKHLGLYYLPCYSDFDMFWDAPSIASKLTSVKLHFSPDFLDRPPDLQLLSVIAERSPYLENLQVYLLDSDEPNPPFEAPASTLDVLKMLPLQILYLDNIGFTGCNNLAKYIATLFSALRVHEMPAQPINFLDLLHLVVKMPHLEHLDMNICVTPLPLPDGFVADISNISRHRHSKFHTLKAVDYHELWCDELYGHGFQRFTYQDAIRLAQ